MELNKVLYMYAATVALLLCSAVDFIQSPSDVFGPVALLEPTPSAARDFGAVVSEAPIAVMQPGSPADIARLLGALSSSSGPRAAVAARGAGHSLHGQAQARGGIVVETRALPRLVEVVRREDGDGGGDAYADVGGGALWVEVLEECLRAGLAPRSWTDYLYLTVGGTLSNGGISGQAFKHGPQISNVLQLEVVTGTGEVVTCSPTQSPELFFAVLGGLGQFGIITRARIPLQLAPPKVRWVRAFYDSFETFTKDQELLVSMPELVDYVEGFMVLNQHSLRSSSVAFPAPVNFSPDFGSGDARIYYYCIEFAVHDFQQQDSAADHVVDLVSGKLSYLRPHVYSVEVAYCDFLNRVRMEEESLRSRGLWDVPHPWLNLFVPSHGVARFKDLLMDTVTQGDFEGPVLVYPLLTDRWDGNTSAAWADLRVCLGIPRNTQSFVLTKHFFLHYTQMLVHKCCAVCNIHPHSFHGGVKQGPSTENMTGRLASTQQHTNREYPSLKFWLRHWSAVVPASPDGVMYVFSVLRSTDPARCGRACVEGILEQHRRVADEACRRLGAKQYLARQPSRAHWRDHFGAAAWDRFVARKARFDPMHVLGPGQGIFSATEEVARLMSS